MPKIVVIGFDGATWDIINPLIEQNKLPTFKTLIKESTWGYMESTVPPMTIPAWISMFSGLTPEQLGMFDFNKVTLKDNSIKMRLFNSTDYKGRLIWDFLSKKGIKSLVLNVPGTYPPFPIEGHLIGLDLTPLEHCTYPDNLEKILIEEFDLNTLKESQKMLTRGEKYALKVIEAEEKKVLEILISFSQKNSYDIIFVRFGIPDHVSHHSLRDEKMESCHILMDVLLKKILQSIEYDYLLLVSDHGLKKEDTIFFINTYLEKRGFPKRPLKLRLYGYSLSLIFKIEKKLKMNLLPLVMELGTKQENFFVHEKMKGRETTVFAYAAMPTNFCPLYSASHASRDKAISVLKNSGYIIDIHPVAGGNGLFALAESNYQISSGFSRKEIDSDLRWAHDMKGIFLAHGKDIKKGRTTCTIYDIAPTLLHVMGLPIPDTFTGRIIDELFEEDSEIKKRTPQYVSAGYYAVNEEKEKIKHSLEKLGRL